MNTTTKCSKERKKQLLLDLCILIHGAVGVTPDAMLEMIVTMILIYGMLIVRKETGNAWGCVLIFFVYWNAL